MLCLDSLSTNLISSLFARLYLFGFVNTHVSPSPSPSPLPAYWSLLMDWLWFRRRLTCFPILLFSPGEINEERPANLVRIRFWGIYSEARPTSVAARVCESVRKCVIGLTETIWCFKLKTWCFTAHNQLCCHHTGFLRIAFEEFWSWNFWGTIDCEAQRAARRAAVWC